MPLHSLTPADFLLALGIGILPARLMRAANVWTLPAQVRILRDLLTFFIWVV
jgi:hypothetical protein